MCAVCMCVCVCVCVCVCAVNIIYSALLYGCDFLWHPQLSLHRITNFAVTFAEKLGSGDNIETGWGGVSYRRCERRRIHAEMRVREQALCGGVCTTTCPSPLEMFSTKITLKASVTSSLSI